jgi:hypothetical protein
VKDIFLLAREGDEVVFPTNNVQKCGNVITAATTRTKAVAAAEQALSRMFVRLVPNNPVTDGYLSAKDDPPDGSGVAMGWSFSLEDRRNREALRSMPPSREGQGEMVIIDLPDLGQETSKDWHGGSILSAMDRLVSVTGVQVVRSLRSDQYGLGKVFWNAFLKGGIQGGVYVIDTIAEQRRFDQSVSLFASGERAQ